MVALAMALSLALAAAPEPEPEGAAPEAPPAPAGAGAELRGWRQDLAVGVESMTFWSHAGHHYTFHSLGLGYLASWGRRGFFVHATALLPLQGREDGRIANIHEFYGMHYGGDLLTGYHGRWRMSPSLEAEAGGGPHAAFLVMKGITGYRDFSASPFGLGASGQLRWRTGHTLSRWPLSVGLFGSAAVDFWDPIHGNDLRHGFTFRAGVSVGLAPGGDR